MCAGHWNSVAWTSRSSPARARYVFRDAREGGALQPTDWRSVFGGPTWQRAPGGQWYLHPFAPNSPPRSLPSSPIRFSGCDVLLLRTSGVNRPAVLSESVTSWAVQELGSSRASSPSSCRWAGPGSSPARLSSSASSAGTK
ncbi:hypothetical protein GCM10010254_23220 [Streptomyces chromofuscus]|nr:hypothetical protein GCM10010254_23220 [Streptomyces chromofuscus]